MNFATSSEKHSEKPGQEEGDSYKYLSKLSRLSGENHSAVKSHSIGQSLRSAS